VVYEERSNLLAKEVEALKPHGLAREAVLEAAFLHADAAFLLASLRFSDRGEVAGQGPLAKTRWQAAKAGYEDAWARLTQRYAPTESLYEWSCRWRDAALAMATDHAGRIAARQDHLDRMAKLQALLKQRVEAGTVSTFELWSAEFFVAEATLQLAASRTERSSHRTTQDVPPTTVSDRRKRVKSYPFK
jgi:DNA-binding transcriptional regulator/RsmH inhibitor MraZ